MVVVAVFGTVAKLAGLHPGEEIAEPGIDRRLFLRAPAAAPLQELGGRHELVDLVPFDQARRASLRDAGDALAVFDVRIDAGGGIDEPAGSAARQASARISRRS